MPLTVILLPLLAIVVLPIKKINRALYSILVCLVGMTNIYLLSKMPVHFQEFKMGWNIIFLIDKYSWFFAVLVNVGWIITVIYSYQFLKYNFLSKAIQFNFYLSLVLVSVLACGFAGNLMTLFITYIATIPFVYPLITLRGGKKALTAGKIYLLQTLMPAALILLPAILLISSFEGNFSFASGVPVSLQTKPLFASILLAMFVIGMSKNCVFPFNGWLPKTMIAPAPVSALVHSIAAVKIGSISLIKIAVYVYGLDFLHQLTAKPLYAGWLTYLCGITAVHAAYKALKADNLKVRFSYSTVSQLSYIITAILIATKAAILGAVMHVITHSIAKICLFFVAGFYNSVYGTTKISEINKIVNRTPWMVVAVAICGLSIAGFPLLAGYCSKDLMLIEELHSGNYAAGAFLLLGSILNFCYIFPLVKNAFLNKSELDFQPKHVPICMQVAISICVILITSMSFYTYNIIRAFENF